MEINEKIITIIHEYAPRSKNKDQKKQIHADYKKPLEP